ncbi:MAG TPA: PQQ-dependent sugar dehydrogenase [Blastocatellia bacterium]|nr:PQQ-dependent sugar dehydrogenase [Blastocatellia bacterium]
MAFTPDGRLFVTTQDGQVRVIKDGALLPTPFLTVVTDTYQERGLNGIAIDPDFVNNQYVYVYYTATAPTVHNRVSRFTANGDVALAGSETVILDLDDLRTDGNLNGSHNSGDMHFGLDGKLYISVGDNAIGTNSQTLSNLLGKVLRINKDGTIPTDNPFYNTATGRNRAIWVMGLRNPFTFDIQPGTGRIFINDVGLASWEEINEGVASANYGWPDTEGYTTDLRFNSPIYAYPHGDGNMAGCAITGGTFYNPAAPRFPAQYIGKYFFMDYCNLWINVFDPQTRTATNFATGLPSWPLGIISGPDAALYYISHVGTDEGIYKIAYTGNPAPQIGEQPTDQLIAEGESATVKIIASGEPTLSFQWQRSTDGGVSYLDLSGATSSTYTTPPMFLADSGAKFRCVVTNSYGTATSNAATVTVTTNKRPTATITQPVEGAHYNAGDTISYQGAATDPEDGSLPAASFTWQVDFHHHTHFHPFLPATGGSTGGSFTIPLTGETDADVWYRITLTVVDSGGLTQTTYRDVVPNTSTITLATSPPGLQVTLDGLVLASPYSVAGVAGMTRQIGVLSPQTVNGITYYFDSWSDGGAATHAISTQPTDTAYTAVFRQGPGGTISASPSPIQVCDGSGLGTTTLTWASSGVTNVEVHVGSPSGTLFASSGPGTLSKVTGKWVANGMVFYLQDVSNGLPLTSANTLATVTVNLTKLGCGTINASPNPIQVCDGSGLGTTTLTWASTAATVEVHVGSPNGSLFASSGPGTFSKATGKWVTNGMVFYLQDVSNGLPLTAANTLATVQVATTNNCSTGSMTAGPNPIHVCDGTGLGATTLSWTSAGTSLVEVHIGRPDGQLFAQSGPGSFSMATGKWVTDGTVFYLQDVSNGLPLTAANTLATLTVNVASSGCVAITQQPSSQIIAVGQAATFSVGAAGDAPLAYQWQRNGVNIPGATTASYTIAAAAASDNGAQFRCVVSNPYGSATSNGATLTVTAVITLASSPTGLRLMLDSQTQSAPFSIISQLGALHTLGVVSQQTLNGITYFFDSWSDGGAATHTISTPNSNATYTATFRYDDAVFVSQSVPTGTLKPGQRYTVSVTLRNAGTSTWTISNSYKLGSQNPADNLTWGLNRVSLPSSVAPGANVTFSFTITAPSTRGDYNYQWKMVHEGVGGFGALTPNVVLKVR